MQHLINVIDMSHTDNTETALNRPLHQSANLKTRPSNKPTVAPRPSTVPTTTSPAQPLTRNTNVIRVDAQAKSSGPGSLKVTLEPFRLFAKEARLYKLVEAELQGLCLPSKKQLESGYAFQPDRFMCSAKDVKRRAYKLVKRGHAGLWSWNEKLQAARYKALKKVPTLHQTPCRCASFTGWATNKVEGSPPPPVQSLPAGILNNFQHFQWYWHKDRWLLFLLHKA
ncbi:hypothetical protein PCANC_15232 [Puccinia coronata f. sp. avenae]|uniref:Uncharacterized protein n=1 Tax=Puccinia coronata f. sp. avenae TaxID=200324 RepID=A0A2N5VNL6_9BASI|nr:hypothetical protein PCANC_15232 [Puccinia coronata f. sp. avenae]